MEAVFFWIVWGAISFWALKTFYYSFSKEKLERLRKSALGINLAVLVLTFLPWLPPTLGGKNGLTLAFEGNTFEVAFFVLLIVSVVLFAMKRVLLLKIAALATIANTFLLFILMFQLRPGNIILTFYDIAPIVAVLLLLVACVVGLLLWQQLQLQEKARTRRHK